MSFKKSFAALGTLLFAAVFIVSCGSTPKEAYDTFSLIMDRLAGAGNWSAKSHEESSSGVLTVSGLTVKLPGETPAPEASPAAEGEKATTEAQPAPARDLEIATVEIKKLVDKKTAEGLLAAADWKNQKETKLADSLILKGVSHKLPFADSVSDMSLEELNLGSLALAAAGADGPEGFQGFLKALRLGSLGYKNFKVTTNSPQARTEVLAGAVSAEGVSFEGEPLTGLEAFDPTGYTGLMTSMVVKKAAMKDMSISFQDPSGENKGTMTVAEVQEEDVKGMGSIGKLAFKGFKFDLIDEEKRQTMMTLEEISMNGFDMSRYLKKMMPFFAASLADPDHAGELLGELQTIGDFFVSPISVDDMVMRGLEMKLADYFTIKMAEARVAGPYQAGEIPASQKSAVKGLEIILPEDGDLANETVKEIVEFGRLFGMNRFEIEAEGDGQYDPATGTVTSAVTRFTIKDLADFTATFELGGLTPERVEKLNQTPLTMIYIALMAPDAVFGDLAFNAFSLKLTDHGLVTRSFDYAAKKENAEKKPAKDVTGAELREATVARLAAFLSLRGAEVLKNPEQLSKPLVTFLEKPENLELSLKAEPPFGLKSVMAMGGDKSKVLNSLNLKLSANGESVEPMVFAITDRPYGPADMEDEPDFTGEDEE